jgi:DNA-binding NarL/FixJ family response regulator
MIRLFLVEDQALVRGALKVLLELEPDFKVVGEASNGREAVDNAQKQPVDVFLLDVEMPDMDGLTAAEQLRRLTPSARIVVLTGGDGEARRLDARRGRPYREGKGWL